MQTSKLALVQNMHICGMKARFLCRKSSPLPRPRAPKPRALNPRYCPSRHSPQRLEPSPQQNGLALKAILCTCSPISQTPTSAARLPPISACYFLHLSPSSSSPICRDPQRGLSLSTRRDESDSTSAYPILRSAPQRRPALPNGVPTSLKFATGGTCVDLRLLHQTQAQLTRQPDHSSATPRPPTHIEPPTNESTSRTQRGRQSFTTSGVSFTVCASRLATSLGGSRDRGPASMARRPIGGTHFRCAAGAAPTPRPLLSFWKASRPPSTTPSISDNCGRSRSTEPSTAPSLDTATPRRPSSEFPKPVLARRDSSWRSQWGSRGTASSVSGSPLVPFLMIRGFF